MFTVIFIRYQLTVLCSCISMTDLTFTSVKEFPTLPLVHLSHYHDHNNTFWADGSDILESPPPSNNVNTSHKTYKGNTNTSCLHAQKLPPLHNEICTKLFYCFTITCLLL